MVNPSNSAPILPNESPSVNKSTIDLTSFSTIQKPPHHDLVMSKFRAADASLQNFLFKGYIKQAAKMDKPELTLLCKLHSLLKDPQQVMSELKSDPLAQKFLERFEAASKAHSMGGPKLPALEADSKVLSERGVTNGGTKPNKLGQLPTELTVNILSLIPKEERIILSTTSKDIRATVVQEAFPLEKRQQAGLLDNLMKKLFAMIPAEGNKEVIENLRGDVAGLAKYILEAKDGVKVRDLLITAKIRIAAQLGKLKKEEIGSLEKALKELQLPDHFENLFKVVQIHEFVRDEFSYVKEHWEEGPLRDEGFANARLEAGRRFLALGKKEEAFIDEAYSILHNLILRDMPTIEKSRNGLLFRVAEAWMSKNSLGEALWIARDLSGSRFPEDKDNANKIFREVGIAYAGQGKFDEAQKIAFKISEGPDMQEEVLNTISNKLFEQNKDEEVLKLINSCKDDKVRYLLADKVTDKFLSKNKPKEALQIAEQEVLPALKERNYMLHDNQLSDILNKFCMQNDFERAEELAERMIEPGRKAKAMGIIKRAMQPQLLDNFVNQLITMIPRKGHEALIEGLKKSAYGWGARVSSDRHIDAKVKEHLIGAKIDIAEQLGELKYEEIQSLEKAAKELQLPDHFKNLFEVVRTCHLFHQRNASAASTDFAILTAGYEMLKYGEEEAFITAAQRMFQKVEVSTSFNGLLREIVRAWLSKNKPEEAFQVVEENIIRGSKQKYTIQHDDLLLSIVSKFCEQKNFERAEQVVEKMVFPEEKARAMERIQKLKMAK